MKRKAKQIPRVTKKHAARRRARWWLAVSLVAAVAAGVIIIQSVMRQHADQTVETATADTAWDPQWPNLPHSGAPALPVEQVRAAYAFAARREDVMQYVPCYCGCEAQGHRSAHDCFVRSRTPEGVPQWDEMGFT